MKLYTARGQGAPITIGVAPSVCLSETAWPTDLDCSAYGLALSVSTQQMRDVTCLRTKRTETARPAASSIYWRDLDRQRTK